MMITDIEKLARLTPEAWDKLLREVNANPPSPRKLIIVWKKREGAGDKRSTVIALLREGKLKQCEIAEAAGVSVSYVSKVKAGVR
ncbi:ArsR family transcriptional regulator [Erythrobacter arachoides]|uniref:ArsR family transcriptional regulator n=1 Tax=Aurantiacibacter arachoides TaxID=1850444 RepID=A0A845A2W7_9SPHN|nr:ArsR family transcriptional regulator [Aurantiacibacter arachoides]MXO94278.1 ArsR family transcriptional regulator [Aurantiacibacter arachoides]GGD64738.1 hypothetical protein GCM10011411_26300 [Aurantiacibacter arachoides]